jgi:hypothetical protein
VALLVALVWAPVVSAAPANDEFSAAEELSASLPVGATGSNVEATKETDEPDHAGIAAGHSVWYSWQAPGPGLVTVGTCGSDFETVLGVYTGSAVDGLTKVGSGSFSRGPKCAFSGQSEVTFKATAGTTYRIAVDGAAYEEEFEEEEFEANTEGEIELAIAPTAPPANDAFADSQALSGPFPFVEAQNWGATKEAGEPAHAGNKGGASTWYSWTAPRSGLVFGFACATFESLFGVYTGGAVNDLAPVASATTSEFECEGLSFAADAGVTYRIAVDGAYSATLDSGQMGTYLLELWMPPSNDDFRNAWQLPGSTSFLFSQSTLGATRQVGDPRPAGIEEPGATVWFNWTAPGTGTVSLDTCGSDFDTFLGVYIGQALGALAQVAVNDNSPGPYCPRTRRSELAFAASAGTTYRFMVGGPEFEQGELTLRLSEALSAPPAAARDIRAPKTIPGKRVVKGRARKATFTFRSDEPGSKFRCKLDRRPFKACSSPKTYKHLRSGRHTFKVAAVDAAGNIDRTPAIAHFLIPKF